MNAIMSDKVYIILTHLLSSPKSHVKQYNNSGRFPGSAINNFPSNKADMLSA